MAATNSPPPRLVPCMDVVGRERRTETWMAPHCDKVVLRVPPGEVALLTPQQARTLRDDLDHQAALVETQHADSTQARGE